MRRIESVYRIFLIVVLLLSIGVISLTDKGISGKELVIRDSLVSRQFIWIMVSLLVFFFCYHFGYRRFLGVSIGLYFINLLLLILVLIFGPIKSGAQRWLSISGINFQPSELAKLSIILAITQYLVSHKDEIIRIKIFITALAMFLIYILLIFLQPDLGSAFILVPIFISIALVCNIRKKNIIILIMLGLLFSPLLWRTLKEYQKQRILVFINPNIDPLGAGYTVIQSKIAIGSGRLLGKIWFKNPNQFSFLPESHTDFVFSSLGEKFGFIGTSLIILIYYLLLREILNIGILTNDPAGKSIAVGVATMIFSHVFINIGMCLGILPVVGLPLPFISYGGSNLLVNMAGLGIVASIGKRH
ncbi:MAG: rod shape-determining protein RodA [Candidatus Omnitrophota bacterium]